MLAMSASQRRVENYEGGDPKNRNKERPFNPDGFPLMLQQPGKQVNDGNTQPVNGVKQYTEENEYLEGPIFINSIQKTADIASQEGCQ